MILIALALEIVFRWIAQSHTSLSNSNHPSWITSAEETIINYNLNLIELKDFPEHPLRNKEYSKLYNTYFPIVPRDSSILNLDTALRSPKAGYGRNTLKMFSHRSLLKLRNTEDHIFDVQYNFDTNHIRSNGLLRSGQYFLVALGDSFTFGYGVKDQDTYPAQLDNLREDLAIYNLGLPGTAPNEILGQIEAGFEERHKGISQVEGDLIYLFIAPQIDRFLCNFKSFVLNSEFITEFPTYKLEQDGKLAKQTINCKSKWIRNKIYAWLSKSALLQELSLNGFNDYDPDDYEAFAEALLSIQKTWKKNKKINSFYFIFYPGVQPAIVQGLRPALIKRGIQILDYSKIDLPSLTNSKDHIPVDIHPSPEAYWILAHLLAKDLPKIYK